MQAVKKTVSISKIVNTIIGLSIMILGPFFDSPQFLFPSSPQLIELGFPIVNNQALITISDAGWTASIIFLGLIWLWTTVDTLWPSLLSLVLLALSPHFQLPTLFAQYFGFPTIAFLFFLLFFIAAITRSQVASYFANFLLTRNFIQGRPWILVTTLLFTVYACALVDLLSSPFICLPVVYLILHEVGCKEGDKLSIFLVGNVIASFVLAFTTDAIKGGAVFMLGGFSTFVANNPQLGLGLFNPMNWIIMTLILSTIGIFAIVFCMRFIFRVDVSPLKNFNTQSLRDKPLPPMNWKQKTIIALLVVYIIWMLVPSLLPADLPITNYLKSRSLIGACALCSAVLWIKHKGERLYNVSELASSVAWGIYFLLASAYLFGNLLIAPGTNISILLELLFRNTLQGLGYYGFILLIMVLAIIITNFMNSNVMAIILAPIVAQIALSYGFDAMPIAILFIYVLALAVLTPGSGIAGAILYGNREWLPGSAAFSYALFLTVLFLVIAIVFGIPLAKILF